MTQSSLRFDGETYQARNDKARLSSQFVAVRELMSDGRWRTLPEIRSHVGGSEAGVSARLRDLRKERFGSFIVKRQRRGDDDRGLHEYQVTPGVAQ